MDGPAGQGLTVVSEDFAPGRAGRARRFELRVERVMRCKWRARPALLRAPAMRCNVK